MLTIKDGIADVRLSRPDKRNALDMAMFEAIADTIRTLEGADDLRCVVLSGEGADFCAGLDLSLMQDAQAVAGNLIERTYGDANLFQYVAWGWRMLPVPVIAAVSGNAFGGGCQIMLGADIRIAAPDAAVALMEMRWGIIPDMGAFPIIRSLLKDDDARELVYTAKVLQADEAVKFGLLTRTVDDPLTEAMTLAGTIAGQSPMAIRAAKRMLNAMHDKSAAELLRAESEEQIALLAALGQQKR